MLGQCICKVGGLIFKGQFLGLSNYSAIYSAYLDKPLILAAIQAI